jgi:hypothetical protein
MSGLVAGLVAACVAHQPVGTRSMDLPDPPYEKVHDRATRELRLYQHFDTQLVVWATLLTEDVRTAGARDLAYRGAMEAAEAEALVARSVAEGTGAWEVIFAAMWSHDEAKDFGSSADDPWHVRLLVDERACTPTNVEPIVRPTAAERVLYSQVNDWSDLWRARFDQDCGSTGDVVFSVAGPYASGEVSWSE